MPIVLDPLSPAGSWTYDLTTPTGQVRLLVPDRVPAEAIFSDEEIGAFLGLEDSDPKRAAALALETIASDEALVQKVIRLLEYSTNGAATAQALLGRAKTLREQAALQETDGAFDVIEMVEGTFSRRERYLDELRRGA